MAKKFLISYAYDRYIERIGEWTMLGRGNKVVELEAFPQSDHEIGVLEEKLRPAGIRFSTSRVKIIAISPLQ